MTSAGSLHKRTLELLKKSDKSLPVIFKESNLPYWWLKKFKEGDIANPSVNRVQALYEYLTASKLSV